jgi:hypothetical protein
VRNHRIVHVGRRMAQLHLNEFNGLFEAPANSAGPRRWRWICAHINALRSPAKRATRLQSAGRSPSRQ